MEVKPLRQGSVPAGYKQTEGGVIPDDWTISSVGAEFSIQLGKMLDAEKNVGVPKPFLGNRAVQWGKIDLTDIGEIKLTSSDLQRFRLRNGDLLVCEGGEIGRAAVWQHPIEECYYQKALHRLRPLRGYNVQLMLNILQRLASTGFLLNFVTQTSIAHLPKDKFETVPIPLPPTKAEQEAIAEALSDADALIESLDQLFAKKRKLKQGAMQELLTGKKRLPGFGGKWEKKRLGDVIEKFVGGGTPSRANPQYWGSEIPWVTVKDFATFNPRQSQEAITSVGLQNSASHLIPQGTLITSTRMALGKAVVYEVDVAINQDLKALFPKSDLATQYLYFWFQYHGQSIDELGSGSTVKGISLADIKKIEFQLPLLTEQTAIAAILSDMDAEIAALEAKLAKARQLKQGMMQELLTGRIRLVKPEATIGRPPVRQTTALATGKSHNWQFNEAVVISVLAKNFGSERWPLGRKRYTKLSYLLHRHEEGQAVGYLKKAAGPYNPATKYKGPEEIALKNGYVRRHTRDNFSGFVAAEKIGEAERYFARWYGDSALAWLEQFRRNSNDELELLATVDMAMVDLHKKEEPVQLATVKRVIRNHPEWESKLDRAIFSDDNISRAMKTCRQLFDSLGID